MQQKHQIPAPLIATKKPSLIWQDDGTPVAGDFDDIYFSRNGGLEECKQVFLRACNLPDEWQNQPVFTICELGFGTGLNFLACMDLWQKTAGKDQYLYFTSIEAWPLDKREIAKALSVFPQIKDNANMLISQWPGRVKATHRLHFGNVVLDIIHDDVTRALSGLDIRANAWFLDGFSPAKNPDMWSEEVFSQIASLSAKNARIGTFSVAGKVRRGLEAAGFATKKAKGFAAKRERLEAIFTHGKKSAANPPEYPPVIIGAGIAGAAIAKAFLRRGRKPIMIDPYADLQTAASGNPLGLLMPKLDLQDRPESRFYNAAFLYAKNIYPYESKGIIQIAKSSAEEQRFEKLLQYAALPDDEMQPVSIKQAKEMTGFANINRAGIYFASGMTIMPVKCVKQLRQGAKLILKTAAKINRQSGLWQVYDNNGRIIAKTDNLFIANGANIKQLTDIDVRFTKGQVCWTEELQNQKSDMAMIKNHYLVNNDKISLIGASHSHCKAGEDNKTDPGETEKLKAGFEHFTGKKMTEKHVNQRAGVRVTTRNTLPIAFEQEKGLFILSGLGSRGFMLAPLLAEHLVCISLDLPGPLDKTSAARFIPKGENL